MRKADIELGGLYAANVTMLGQRPPAYYGERNPRWKAGVEDDLDHGRWKVRLLDSDCDRTVRSAAIEEPWESYTDRMQRWQAARDAVREKRLTWEEFQEGAPCPGCGRAYIGLLLGALRSQRAVDLTERLLAAGSLQVSDVSTHLLSQVVGEGVARTRDGWAEPTGRARAALDAHFEDEAWQQRHECDPDLPPSGWHRYGSGPLHCMGCCPPPPLSPRQIEEIGRILAPVLTRRGGYW